MPTRSPRAADGRRDQLARARAFAGRCSTARRSTPAKTRWPTPTAWRRSCERIGAAPAMQAAAYLVYAGDYLTQARGGRRQGLRRLAREPGDAHAQAGAIQRAAREAQVARTSSRRSRPSACARCCSRSRATCASCCCGWRRACRRCATSPRRASACPAPLARESMQVFAPLANRLGIWQIKWELEDLSFRFLQPDDYRAVARLLDETRVERERQVEAARRRARRGAARRRACSAEVQGRPKHLYSIWKKMQGKGLDFAHVFDVRALRVIVDTLPDCYAALSRVHELYRAVPGEFDDYIARPEAQRLPVAAHRGAGRRRPAGRDPDPHARDARARRARRRRALGLQGGRRARLCRRQRGRRLRGAGGRGAQGRAAPAARLGARLRRAGRERRAPPARRGFDDRIYVFTPQAAVVELPAGATAIDFAYSLHTDLGHRCRGARVDGAMLPLNTPLQNGQTVEIVAAKEGGPSLDWLNAELGYLRSPRSRAKVRAWFNALAHAGARSRAAARRSRSCCSAKARPRSSSTTWPRSSAFATPTRCSRSSARTSSRCATSRPCCARPSRRRRPTS